MKRAEVPVVLRGQISLVNVLGVVTPGGGAGVPPGGELVVLGTQGVDIAVIC